MNLSQIEEKDFQRAKECHICNEKFQASKAKSKVRDHDHVLGMYRGPAHVECNLQYKINLQIPIVFHNLFRYDIHHFVNEICNNIPGRVLIIGKTDEKYLGFIKRIKGVLVKLTFKDSFNFLSFSLEKLAATLSSENFIHLKQSFKGIETDTLKLLMQKGVMFYDYITDVDVLKEKQLPKKEDFFNSLNKKHITNEEYNHAKKVWNTFNVQNIREYIYLYMKCDVLILVDIFENFRKICIQNFTLDPICYISLPSYCWDTCLYFTKVELELLTDLNQILFLESGLRGGRSQVSLRYGCANNKFIPNYNKDLEDSYIIYFDVNNLYGGMLTLFLPTSNFQWLSHNEILHFDVEKNYQDPNIGYILEIDLHFDSKIHNKLKDLPPAYEKKPPPNTKIPKLLATLEDKKNYVVHIRNLKFYIELGIKLTKIHRVLRYNHSCWMKKYIYKCITLRQQSTNEFDIATWKLFVNACFGKSIENVRKYRDFRIATKWGGRSGLGKLVQNPNFHNIKVFNENLAVVEMKKSKIVFNKPIYVGFLCLGI